MRLVGKDSVQRRPEPRRINQIFNVTLHYTRVASNLMDILPGVNRIRPGPRPQQKNLIYTKYSSPIAIPISSSSPGSGGLGIPFSSSASGFGGCSSSLLLVLEGDLEGSPPLLDLED